MPLCKLAVKIMLGRTIADLGLAHGIPAPRHVSVKEAVLPLGEIPRRRDSLLGPEMKSTGEVMGIADHFGRAFAKAQLAAGHKFPVSGRVFLSLADKDKRQADIIARSLAASGFDLVATAGTTDILTPWASAAAPLKKCPKVGPTWWMPSKITRSD